MKSTIAKIALSSVLVSGVLMAGKDAAQVKTPVAPVSDLSGLYVGIGLVWAGISKDCPCSGDERDKDSTYGGIIRLGYDINQYIGVEARAFKASVEEDFSTTTHYGVYLKPQYHVTDSINIYGLLGYGQTEIDFSCEGITDYDDSGVSVGVGIELDLSEDEKVASSRSFDGQGNQEEGVGVWVDYQNLLNDEGSSKIKSNIVTAGVTYDF